MPLVLAAASLSRRLPRQRQLLAQAAITGETGLVGRGGDETADAILFGADAVEMRERGQQASPAEQLVELLMVEMRGLHLEPDKLFSNTLLSRWLADIYDGELGTMTEAWTEKINPFVEGNRDRLKRFFARRGDSSIDSFYDTVETLALLERLEAGADLQQGWPLIWADAARHLWDDWNSSFEPA